MIPLKDADRERDLFDRALDLESVSARVAFLNGACGTHPSLQERVRGLLVAHQGAGRFLGGAGNTTPLVGVDGEEVTTTVGAGVRREKPGEVIGRYKLLEKIGEGGFGVVYLADQREPVRRRVALKILKPGMDTRQVVARFEVERQALALMDHPNIARVLDAGATVTGRPFFVMEWVNGVPITRFCDEHRLTQEERLRLFLSVCHAVQHAHQKGIIHRDIKPSNVLVAPQDDTAVPKVIDFGIAKATQPERAGISLFTRFHELVGTPAYMSPEQARLGAVDVDTRADIYSLGVLLYELLTGRTPFDIEQLAQGGYEAMRQQLLERDPPRPSTRFGVLSREERTTTAHRRRDEPERLGRRLRGDLDWILLKCLEKERSRRYESASALAQDIVRHLNNRPVTAAAPGAWYRAAKFVRRHRAGLAMGMLFGWVLVAGTITSSGFAIQARQAERRASAEAAEAEAVLRFFNEDLLSQADPALEPDRELRLRTLLDRAAVQVGERFAGAPRLAAAIHVTIGQAYTGLGEYASAVPHLERAVGLFAAEWGEGHPDAVRVLSDLAFLKSRQGEHDAARILGERSVALATRGFGRASPLGIRCLTRLTEIATRAGDTAQRRALAREVVELCRRVPGVDPEDQAAALQAWGRSLGREGRIEEGEAEIRAAHELLVRHCGERHPQTLNARNRLAAYLYDHVRGLDEAERLWLDVLQIARRTLGETHVRTLITRWNLALLYRYRMPGREAQAVDQLLRLIEFSPASDQPKYAAALREVLPALPPGTLETLAGAVSEGWRGRRAAPSGPWVQPGEGGAEWMPVDRMVAAEMWMRWEFEVSGNPPERLYLIVENEGEFEVTINGVKAAASGAPGLEGFQVIPVQDAARRALRLGRNCLAVHGRNLAVDQPIRLILGWVAPEALGKAGR